MAAAGTADELGRALCGAARAGNTTEAARLLDRGANLEAKNKVRRQSQSSPTCQSELLVSDGLTATRPVHTRGVAQWRLGGLALQRGRAQRYEERESCGRCVGVDRVIMCCRRGGQVLDPSLQARVMQLIRGALSCGHRRMATRF